MAILTSRSACVLLWPGADASSSRDVDRVCDELFLSRRARERDDNLVFVRERMLRSEVDTASLLTVYAKVRRGAKIADDPSDPLVTVLRLSGITRVEHGRLGVRNRIYGQVFDGRWVRSCLPGAELRRQRAAYMRGLKLASGVLVPLLLLTAGYGVYLYRLNPTIPIAIRRSGTMLEPPPFWASFGSAQAPVPDSGGLLVNAGGSGVRITINGREYGSTSREGKLRVPIFTAGIYDVAAEKPGFQAVQQRVQIRKNAISTVNFKLLPVSVLGGLFGTITDSAGTPVSGATITLTGADGKTTRLTTNNSGRYAVQGLTAENYTITTEAPRFKSVTTPVTIFANQLSQGDAQLIADNEWRDWEQAAKSRDAKQVAAFLSNYPAGSHAEMARNLLAQLHSEERAAWGQTSSANNLATYEDFLRRYPNSEYAGTAHAQMEKLQAEVQHNAFVPSPAPAAVDDGRVVLTVLSQYQRAYEDRKVEELTAIWPNMTSRQISSLREFFKDAQHVSLTYDLLGKPEINHDEATVRFTQSLNYTVRGKTQRPDSAEVVMRLRKLASTQGALARWVIDSIR